MRTNPLLEEVWRIKDQLAAEAGFDMDRYFENLRRWEAEHPHHGPVVHGADELRQLAAQREQRRAQESVLAFNEEPPAT
jgi:hypothetical protein